MLYFFGVAEYRIGKPMNPSMIHVYILERKDNAMSDGFVQCTDSKVVTVVVVIMQNCLELIGLKKYEDWYISCTSVQVQVIY